MTEDAIAIALSQAAFGAVTLMFIAYSTVVSNKVNERDMDKERSLVKDYEEAGLPVAHQPVFYLYIGAKAALLSRDIRSASTYLAVAYVVFLLLSTVMISPEWLSWSTAKDLARSLESYGYSPHDPSIGYTLLVVLLAWHISRRSHDLFSGGRHP